MSYAALACESIVQALKIAAEESERNFGQLLLRRDALRILDLHLAGKVALHYLQTKPDRSWQHSWYFGFVGWRERELGTVWTEGCGRLMSPRGGLASSLSILKTATELLVVTPEVQDMRLEEDESVKGTAKEDCESLQGRQ